MAVDTRHAQLGVMVTDSPYRNPDLLTAMAHIAIQEQLDGEVLVGRALKGSRDCAISMRLPHRLFAGVSGSEVAIRGTNFAPRTAEHRPTELAETE
jgi:hypothetical protein